MTVKIKRNDIQQAEQVRSNVAVDNEGNVIEEDIPISTFQDTNGNYVLRMIDAAPFHYDENKDVSKVSERDNNNLVILADSEEIRATGNISRNFVTHGGLSEGELRKYRKIHISVYNTHDKEASFRIMPYNSALGGYSGSAFLYNGSNVIPAENGRILFLPQEGGAGSDNIIIIPALIGVYTNLQIQFSFAGEPTQGDITIHAELQK